VDKVDNSQHSQPPAYKYHCCFLKQVIYIKLLN